MAKRRRVGFQDDLQQRKLMMRCRRAARFQASSAILIQLAFPRQTSSSNSTNYKLMKTILIKAKDSRSEQAESHVESGS